MKPSVSSPLSTRMQRTLARGATGVCSVVTGVLVLTGCSHMVEATDEVTRKFSADSSLLGPTSSTTYVVHGTLAEDMLPATSGTLVVSNGMITSAEFVASVESPNDLRFVLTEPALYERHGEVLDSIKALGTLATQSALYPDTRVTLTPQVSAQGTIVDATFAVPESLTADTARTTTEVTLTLTMEPLATFDDTDTSAEPSDNGSDSTSDDAQH